MRTSDQINELSAALAKAQGEMESANKSAKNPHFGNKYADLAEVWYSIREQLSKYGLAVIQTPLATYDNGVRVSVTTRLLHSSGQWIEETLTLTPTKADPQGVGSAITYARRYALAAIVGIAQDDDDGNAASGNPGKPAEKQTEQKKTEQKKEPAKQPDTKPAEKPAEQKQPAHVWDFAQIEAVIRPELVEEIRRARIGKQLIIKYFNDFDGHQDAILEKWKAFPAAGNDAKREAA